MTVSQDRVSCLLGRDPVYVGRAREHACKALAQWGLAEHADLAQLIVSELVTNALRHGEGPVTLRLSHTGHQLRSDVHDFGAGRPVRKHATVDDESGRGLDLLHRLIELHGGDLGVTDDQTGSGKTVHVTLTLTAAPPSPR